MSRIKPAGLTACRCLFMSANKRKHSMFRLSLIKFDQTLLRMGLCRTQYFNDMKANYGKVISMAQGQARRAKASAQDLHYEAEMLRQKLERAQFERDYFQDLVSPRDKIALQEAWKARETQKSQVFNDLN